MKCEEIPSVEIAVASGTRRTFRLGVILAYIACVLIWGTTWFAIRLCIAEEGYPPFLAGAIRFGIAATLGTAIGVFLLGGWRLWRRRGSAPIPPPATATSSPPTMRNWTWLGLAAVFGTVGAGLVYSAEVWISGAVCSIINSMTPLVMAVVATITGVERVSRSSVIGSVIGCLGIGIIFHDRLTVSLGEAIGVGLMLGSVIIQAMINVAVKRHVTIFHPIICVAVFNLVSAVMFWTWSIAFAGETLPAPPSMVPTAAIIYLAIFGSMVAFGLYFYLIKRVSLMALSALVFFPPIIALIVDALWEKQFTLTTASYAGIAVTLLGLAISLLLPALRSQINE